MTPPPIPFVKTHGLGNDFLLVEESALTGVCRAEVARRICDRRTGVGADGLVVLGASAGADASFRIYNADSSEAGLSGNALRCAAAWLASRGMSPGDLQPRGTAPAVPCVVGRQGASAPGVIALDTRVGRRELFFLRRRGAEWIFRAEIGHPSFVAADVPFRPPGGGKPLAEPIIGCPLPVGDTVVQATILSMGNPQCIILLDDWALLDWQGLGAELERHPYFPDRANIGFVRVLAPDRIEARFWERGAGHTLASGTGSCASAIAAHLAGKTGRRVMVAVERGEMEVNWRDDALVELTGPAEIVAQGTFEFHL